MNTMHNTKHDQYFVAVLDAALEGQKTNEYHTADRLYDLKEKSNNSGPLFIELLDYYIGEASGEILTEFITEKGKTVLPLLVAKKRKPIECLAKYKNICMDRFPEALKIRNEKIDQMVDAIQKGIILRAEDPNAK